MPGGPNIPNVTPGSAITAAGENAVRGGLRGLYGPIRTGDIHTGTMRVPRIPAPGYRIVAQITGHWTDEPWKHEFVQVQKTSGSLWSKEGHTPFADGLIGTEGNGVFAITNDENPSIIGVDAIVVLVSVATKTGEHRWVTENDGGFWASITGYNPGDGMKVTDESVCDSNCYIWHHFAQLERNGAGGLQVKTGGYTGKWARDPNGSTCIPIGEVVWVHFSEMADVDSDPTTLEDVWQLERHYAANNCTGSSSSSGSGSSSAAPCSQWPGTTPVVVQTGTSWDEDGCILTTTFKRICTHVSPDQAGV